MITKVFVSTMKGVSTSHKIVRPLTKRYRITNTAYHTLKSKKEEVIPALYHTLSNGNFRFSRSFSVEGGKFDKRNVSQTIANACISKSQKVNQHEPRAIFGNDALLNTFESCTTRRESALISFLTSGYPEKEDTVPLLLALQESGTDIIELGVPFTDPQADGTTIQRASEVSLMNNTTLKDCLEYISMARSKGLQIPVVLMGYYNPFLAYHGGLENLMKDVQKAGADGFIVVDLPPDEGKTFVNKCNQHKLSYIPLLTPTSTTERLRVLADSAGSFCYCVSLTGVTGTKTVVPASLPNFVKRIRSITDKPLAVGFGISTPDQVETVSHTKGVQGVVVGSAIVNAIDKVPSNGNIKEKIDAVQTYISSLKAKMYDVASDNNFEKLEQIDDSHKKDSVSAERHFGEYGGRYIPETLIEAHRELDKIYQEAMADPKFIEELAFYRKQFVGGPTPMYFASRLTEHCGGAQIWLKREELAHTGAHKINNAIGQALLAKRIGKKRIIAETGAGQHGVATAAACALLDLNCTIYMGAVDCERQKLNVFRIQMLGGTVVPCESGSKTLKDAINEAMRDWVTNVEDTHYLIGSAIGPHPFPKIVRDFQSVIGSEAREQILQMTGQLPDVVVACVGGGSNAIGMFSPFYEDKSVKLVGVEAGGEGLDGLNSATLSKGSPGVLHGTRTYLQQDSSGQILKTHSISAGLDYPGVGPEHAFYKDSGRAEYVSVTDDEALEAFQKMCKLEGILPALEPSHALYQTMEIAKGLPKDKIVLVNLCGRGDKDMGTVAKYFGVDVN